MEDSFCVSCGRSGPTVHGLCTKCYDSSRELLLAEESYTLDRCTRCGKVNIGLGWSDPTDNNLSDFLRSKIRVSREAERHTLDISLETYDEYNITATVKANITIEEGFVIEKEREVNLHLSSTVCPVCSRIAGNYYEAIVQVRGERPLSDASISDMEDALEDWWSPMLESGAFFISKMERHHHGLDIYVSSASAAAEIGRHIISLYGGETTLSYEQGGRKDGRDVYRKTILVRIPRFRKGDILYVDGRAYAISRIRGHKIWAVDMKTHRKTTIAMNRARKGSFIEKEDAVYDAVVIFQNEDEVQVMHPENYSQITLIKPEGYSISSESVPIAVIEGETYLYPAGI